MPVEITSAVNSVLINLVLAAITLAGAYLTMYIHKGIKKVQAETEKIQDEAARDMLNNALIRLNDIALKTVNFIEQTTKKDILKAISEGKATRDQLKDLALEAYEEILATLEPEYRELIEASLGDAEAYIINLIEEKLVEVKARNLEINTLSNLSAPSA